MRHMRKGAGSRRFAAGVAASVMVAAGVSVADGQVDCAQWGALASVPDGVQPFDGVAAFDSLRNQVVYVDASGDTYEFNPAAGTWSAALAAVPDAVLSQGVRAAMAFDSRRGVMVFVNVNQAVWEWDGAQWTQRGNAPVMRVMAGMVYESDRGVMVLFGGRQQLPPIGPGSDETWEYDGVTDEWTQRFPDTTPLGRERHAMAYDRNRHVTVLFGGIADGGNIVSDTWEFDGATGEWSERTNESQPSPAARYQHAMAFDSARGVTVLAGGVLSDESSATDVWEWDGLDWMQRTPQPPMSTSADPMVFDSAAMTTYLLADNTAFPAALTFPAAPAIDMQPASADAVAGGPAQFTVAASGDFPLTYQWRFNGTAIAGATMSTHAIGATQFGDAGAYDVVVGFDGFVPFSCPTTTSQAAVLHVHPFVPADLNGDGVVDLLDFGAFQDAFGKMSP